MIKATSIGATAQAKTEAMMRCDVYNFIGQNRDSRPTYEFICSGCIDAPQDISAGSVQKYKSAIDGLEFFSCSTVFRG